MNPTSKARLNYRTALILAVSISLLLNLIFVISFVFGRDAVMPGEGMPVRPQFQVGRVLLHFVLNFLLAFILYQSFFLLLQAKQLSGKAKLWLVILLFLVGTAVLSYVFSKIQLSLFNAGPKPEHFIKGSMFRDFFISVIVFLSTLLIFLRVKQQQIALENETLLAENLKTRYVALKNQVDPHFLFNSLNTLSSLIKIDPDKAQEYIQQLAYVFRYTLQHQDIITLAQELRFTQAYCHLMEIRYGDSLQVAYKVDEKYFGYSIISLSLQTLVENAIKHNVISNRQPLLVTISTTNDGTVQVVNHVQLKKEPEGGEGIGLATLSERYRLMWKKDIEIDCSNDMFKVSIPLIKV